MIKSVLLLFLIGIYTVVLSIPALIIVWFSPLLCFRLSKLWCWLVLKSAIGLKIKISGLENIQKNKSYVFLSNHQSAFDIPLLIWAISAQTRFIAKKELGKIPVWGWVVKAMGHVMIDRKNIRRAKGSIDEALNKLKREHLSIVAFPEGTRTRDGNLRNFKKGVFVLAIQAGLPVVPISIKNAFNVCPPGKLRYYAGAIEIKIHPPVSTTEYTMETKEQLIEKVRDVIAHDVE